SARERSSHGSVRPPRPSRPAWTKSRRDRPSHVLWVGPLTRVSMGRFSRRRETERDGPPGRLTPPADAGDILADNRPRGKQVSGRQQGRWGVGGLALSAYSPTLLSANRPEATSRAVRRSKLSNVGGRGRCAGGRPGGGSRRPCSSGRPAPAG